MLAGETLFVGDGGRPDLLVSAGPDLSAEVLLRRLYWSLHILKALPTGAERTFEQDPALALRVLADIALRALSPAVNDPTSAVQALDAIGSLLTRSILTRV